MKRVIKALWALALVVGCGTSPTQACKDQGNAECQKMWSCTGASLKIGKDEASCVSTYDSLCQLGGGACPNGSSVDVLKMTACASDTEKASCDDYKSGTYKAANCAAAMCD